MTIDQAKGLKAKINLHLAHLNEAISEASYAGMSVTAGVANYHMMSTGDIPVIEVDVKIDPYKLEEADAKID